MCGALSGLPPHFAQVHLPLPTRPALFASGRHENSSSTMGLLPDALRRMLLTTYETSGNIGTLGPQVPVILAIAPNQPVVAVNASSGRIIVADAVNTTRCIRYAPGFNATTSSSNGAARPPLDLSACLVSTTVVASAIQEISVQASTCCSWLGSGAVPKSAYRSCSDAASRRGNRAGRHIARHVAAFCARWSAAGRMPARGWHLTCPCCC